MKMYILLRDDIPVGKALVAAAHASLAGYLKFKDEPDTAHWLEGTFHKVVCKVNQKEFENARSVEGNLVLTESTLEGREVAMVLRLREEWPKMFGFLRLFRD